MSVRVNLADIYLREIRAGEVCEAESNSSLVRCEKTCLTGPLDYKYRVIFVLVLGVITNLCEVRCS